MKMYSRESTEGKPQRKREIVGEVRDVSRSAVELAATKQ